MLPDAERLTLEPVIHFVLSSLRHSLFDSSPAHLAPLTLGPIGTTTDEDGITMDIEKVLLASEVVGWLAVQANMPGEELENRIEMAGLLVVTHSYLTEYAANLAKGAEPYDVLIATARGELQLSPRQVDLMRALMPPARSAD